MQQGWYKTLVDRCRFCEIIEVCQDLKYLNALLMLVNILDNDFSFKMLIQIFDSILVCKILIIIQTRIVEETKIDLQMRLWCIW